MNKGVGVKFHETLFPEMLLEA